MEMLETINLASVLLGVGIGSIGGFFFGRSGNLTLSETIDALQDQVARYARAYYQERNLNEGLTQELAEQAKVVK